MALIQKLKTFANRDRNESGMTSAPVQKTKLEIANDFLDVIRENQLKVYYQPVIELNTNRIIGAEALIVWEHPDMGALYLDDFLPFVGEKNRIIELGHWMLDQVCCHYKEWKTQGLPDIRIAVNLSGIQFVQDDIVENVKQAVRKYELEACFLVAEITEMVAIGDYSKMSSDIEKLHALGVRIALDNFGTGFASLKLLSELKPDVVKMDRYLIMNITDDERNSTIVKNAISLAKDLNLRVVSEGIETAEQLDMLIKFNCDAGQGCLFSSPLPYEDFKKIASIGICFPKAHGPMSRFTEMRDYFRVKFPLLLEAVMTITKLNGKDVRAGSSFVLIENMSGGGLCFISNLLLPAHNKLVLQFTTKLLGNEIKVFGRPVWVRNTGADLYKYGVSFIMDEVDRTYLIGILNQYQVKLKTIRMYWMVTLYWRLHPLIIIQRVHEKKKL